MSGSEPPTRKKRGSFSAGLIIGLLLGLLPILLIAIILWPGLQHGREVARRASCANNLKQIGAALTNFANESRGERFPPLSHEAGRLMFTLDDAITQSRIYPEYLADLGVLVCPGDEDIKLLKELGSESNVELFLDDHSYFYLNYVLLNDADMATFAEHYIMHVSEEDAFYEDLPVLEGAGTLGGDVLERIQFWTVPYIDNDYTRRNEKLLSLLWKMPVMIERPENHMPRGGNVLFMDGHVKFMRYPGEWPMTEKTIGILESLDAL